MDTAGTGGRQTDAELACVFGISASHECRRFFVTHLNKADLLLPFAQSLHDAVDAIAGQAENDVDSPIVNGLDKNIGSGGHDGPFKYFAAPRSLTHAGTWLRAFS